MQENVKDNVQDDDYLLRQTSLDFLAGVLTGVSGPGAQRR